MVIYLGLTPLTPMFLGKVLVNSNVFHGMCAVYLCGFLTFIWKIAITLLYMHDLHGITMGLFISVVFLMFIICM